MTTNPAIAAAQALRLAANAVFDGLEVLAASLTATPTNEPTLFDDVKVTETTTVVKEDPPAPEPKPQVKKQPEPVPEEATTRTQVKTEEGATLEQIREILSTLSREGRAADARAFLKKLGYTKLTDIPESLYDQVLPLARELLHD